MPASTLPQRDRPGGRGARDRILQAAAVLFDERGINATGVAELAAAAQVSKRTLYQQFASKDDVVCAYLRASRPAAEAVLDDRGLTARARLLELFDALADAPHPMRGSPFAAAAVELPDPGHPAHRIAAERRLAFARRLADLAREAGARDAEQVGARLALLYDGAAIGAVIADSAEPVAQARLMAATVLRAAIDD